MKIISFFATALFAITACTSSDNINTYENLAAGSTVENFRLIDSNGAERSVNDLKGKNGAILVFVSAQCPVARSLAVYDPF